MNRWNHARRSAETTDSGDTQRPSHTSEARIERTAVRHGTPLRRRGRLLATVSLGFSALLGTAWIRSCLYLDVFEYRWGALAPLTFAQGTANEWQYDVRALTASHMHGVVYVRESKYVSFGAPREELLEQWKDWRGVETACISLAERSNADQDELYYHSPLEWRCADFGVFTTSRQGEVARVVTIPYWFLLLTALIPFIRRRWLVRRDRRRWQRGRCVRCGYDLRGNVTSPDQPTRCPECGESATLPRAGEAGKAAIP